MRSVTILSAMLALMLVAPAAMAQVEPVYPYPADPETPVLGDNFIFFVDGTNTKVQNVIGGTIMNNPQDASDKVIKLGVGSWGQAGFAWDETGVNMEQNIDDGDSLFLDIQVPANTQKLVALTIRDFAGTVSSDPDSDLPFGVTWWLPDSLYDGNWHHLEIPLPFKTKAIQDSAKIGKYADGTAIPAELMPSRAKLNWGYFTPWNGSVSVGPGHEQWKDMTWYRIRRVGISFEGDGGAGPLLDNVYIGNSGVDMSVATQPAQSPLPNLNVTSDGDMAYITWTHDPTSDIGAYNLYTSSKPITGPNDPDARWLAGFGVDGDLSYEHPVYSPHPSDASQTYYYALVAANTFGYVPNDATIETASLTTEGRPIPYIYALTDEQHATIESNLMAGVASADGFNGDVMKPFVLMGNTATDYPGEYTGEMDASAKVWVAYKKAADFTSFYIYAEVMDDSPYLTTVRAPEYDGASGFKSWAHADMGDFQDPTISWNVYLRDQLQFYFGTYDVPFTEGSKGGRKRGATPDYFLSFTPYVTTLAEENTGNIEDVLVRLWAEKALKLDDTQGDTTYFYSSATELVIPPVYENILDGSGARIGWKILAAIDATDLLQAKDASGNPVDAIFEAPADDGIKYIPFAINLVDKDDDFKPNHGNWWEIASTTLGWSTKPDASFYEPEPTVNDVGAVAVVGLDRIIVANETADVPGTFELLQNYPNPFNPSTTIAFELPTASDVTLTVYDVLGRRVATLLQGQQFAAGRVTVTMDARTLTAGTYFYRVEAGDHTATRQMMLVK